MLDVYWHCAEPGDCYLGRILAGLDAMLPSFSVLPPHFTMMNPMADENVKEAMHLMYGPILVQWADSDQDPTTLLLRVLASVVYNFDWIKKTAAARTDHPFNSIPLMFKHDLVETLKGLISIKPLSVIEMKVAAARKGHTMP